MSNASVAESIAARIEQELERVYATRPALASRISRAEGILVTHLSCRRQRLIRVRVRDGRARFLVAGSEGAVYVVDPGDWSCTCPDHHRRGAGCKHALACWALWRVSVRPGMGVVVPMPLRRCSGCGKRAKSCNTVEVGPHEAEWSLTVSEGDVLCRRCASDHDVL